MAFVDTTPLGQFPSLEVFVAAGYEAEGYELERRFYLIRKVKEPRTSWFPPQTIHVDKRIHLDGSPDLTEEETTEPIATNRTIHINLDGTPEV